ncbi:MAG: hypothetical protein ACI9HK_002363 [Pirellulaceae bacterium]|jgi:hypothetical protein
MKFIEMTGKTLAQIINSEDFGAPNLDEAGVTDETIVRINEHGDIEVRREQSWDVIGGLLGEYAERVRQRSGFDWV